MLFNLLDQGFFSGSHFIMNIILARKLTPDGYGGFSVAFTIFLLVSGLQAALILEPVAVFSVKRHLETLPTYLGFQIRLQTGLMVALGLVLLLASLLMPGITGQALMGVAIGLPFILLFWFMRQVCYVETRSKLAMQSSVGYALILIAGLFILDRVEMLSPFSAYLLMAASSLLAAVYPWYRLRVDVIDRAGIYRSSRAAVVWKENLHYGKWIMAAGGANWTASLAYVPLVGLFAGVAQAGAYRAVQNLILPLQQALSAVYLMLLPWLSRQRAEKGLDSLRRTTRNLLLFLALAIVVYNAFLILLSEEILWFVYQNPYYQRFFWLIPFLGLLSLINMLSNMLSISLRAVERAREILWIKIAPAVLTLTIGIWAVQHWMLVGVVLGLMISGMAETVVSVIFYWKYIKRENCA